MSSQATLRDLDKRIEDCNRFLDLIWKIGDDDVVYNLLASMIGEANPAPFFAHAKNDADQASKVANGSRTDCKWVNEALINLRAALTGILEEIRRPDESAVSARSSTHRLIRALVEDLLFELDKRYLQGQHKDVVTLTDAILFALLASTHFDPSVGPVQTAKTEARKLLGHCLIKRRSLDPQDQSLHQTCRDVSMSELATRFHMRLNDASTSSKDASNRPPPDLSQPRSWLSHLLCGFHDITMSLNTQRTEQSARDFMRAFELEAIMEERTYLDYSHVYVNRMRRMVNTSQLQREGLADCIRWAEKLSSKLADNRWTDADWSNCPVLNKLPGTESTSNMISDLARRSKDNLDRMIQLMQRSRNMHGWLASTFADVNIEQDFGRMMRAPWQQVNLKFGTWIRRISSGAKTAVIGVLVGSALTAMLSAKFLPTEKWFWAFVLLSLASGVAVYFGRRLRLQAQLSSCKDRLYFLNPDNRVKDAGPRKETIYDQMSKADDSEFDSRNYPHRVPKEWSDAWSECDSSGSKAGPVPHDRRLKRNALMVSVMAITAPLLFWLIWRSVDYKEYAYLTKNDSGELCLLDSGVTIWPGPGQRILLADGNRPSLLSQAIVYLISPADKHSFKPCTTASNNSDLVSVVDGRRTRRSIFVHFPGDVRGCGAEDWQRQVQSQSNDAYARGVKLPDSAEVMLRSMGSVADNCDGEILLDVLGFASERGFQCTQKDDDQLNLELAEFRREQVIKALSGRGVQFEPGGDKLRWQSSIQRMQMQRLFPEGPDSLSRYVEIRILDDGGCFNER